MHEEKTEMERVESRAAKGKGGGKGGGGGQGASTLTAATLKGMLRGEIPRAGAVTASLDETSRFSIYDKRPLVVVSPESEEEVLGVLRLARRERAALCPRGSGSKIWVGNELQRLDIVLRTEGLDGIVEYDHENLSVTAAAGVALSSLQRSLSERNQFLPLDPFYKERATLGGVVAANSSGPLRFKYGSVRDLVLGMRVALPSGEVIKCGGKVLKNVAGYDMTKLFIGSYGTLGVVTEVTFKLYPVPEAESTVLAVFSGLKGAARFVESILESYLEPSSIDLLNPAILEAVSKRAGLKSPQGYGVAVRLDGLSEAVGREITEIKGVLGAMEKDNGGVEVHFERLETAGDGSGFWDAVSCIPTLHGGVIGFRAGFPLSLVPGVFANFERLAADLGLTLSLYSNAGTGALWGFLGGGGEGVNYQAMADSVGRFRAESERLGGYLVLEDAPAVVKRAIDPWGAGNMGGGKIMGEIKSAFDPLGVMSPGRGFHATHSQ